MSLAIEAFTDNVRQFCQWTECATHDVQTVRQLLLALMQGIPYLVVSGAPVHNPDYARRDDEGRKADHKPFKDFPVQYYREVFSPCDLDDEDTVTGDVHDDLADIYGDLWHGLQALDRGDGVYAVEYWRESYFQHWGHHAASAVYVIEEYYRRIKNAP